MILHIPVISLSHTGYITRRCHPYPMQSSYTYYTAAENDSMICHPDESIFSVKYYQRIAEF